MPFAPCALRINSPAHLHAQAECPHALATERIMHTTETTPNLPIIFEDDHVLVIDKPHDILSQADHTGDPDVSGLCKQYLSSKKNKKGNAYLGLVHRLDRPVGGLMLLAKTPKAAGRLSQQLRDRIIQKTYWAVTPGTPPASGVLTHSLLKDRASNTVQTVPAGDKRGREAVLSFIRLQQSGGLTLLSIHLQTGRPHQIRVQLAEEGYPIWGDYKYGSQNRDEGRTIALRAVELIFEHPILKKEIRLTLPPPHLEPWNAFDVSL